MAESQSQTERRPETPGASDAISYIRFGMDLATRSDMQELRVEFNERLDGTNERRGAAKRRRIAAKEWRADTPGASDAISCIRFGMDLATRSDIHDLRVEFNKRLDAMNERRGAEKLRRIAENKRRGAAKLRLIAENERRGAEKLRRIAASERRGAEKLRRIAANERRGAANEQPADAIIERLNGLIADVESLRATVKRVGWILGTLIVVGGAVNVALMIFG